MGIYSDENIYGITFVHATKILYEQKYPHVMSCKQIHDAKTFYNGLDIELRNSLTILFYKLYTTTLPIESNPPMFVWLPGNVDELIRLFKGAPIE